MDCKELEKMIPAFVGKTLEYKDLKKFMEHIDGCPSCKEELTIQVLVFEGMARLEEGSAFDLQKEMDSRMQEAGRKIRFHELLKYISITLELAALAAVVIIIMLFILH